MKSVAVVILNWNGASLLSEFLPSVCRYTSPHLADVIVADNGSTDTSLQLLAQEFPQVGLIRFPRNHGYAEGYNQAVKELETYKYIVLLNSDVAVSQGWIERLLEYAEEHPEVGALQPKIRSYRHPSLFEYAGASGGFLDCNGFPFCRGRIFDAIEEDNGQYDDVADILWASGAALFIRREVYVAVGGLDADFFAHMEEIDLCWRIRLAGYAVRVVPQSVVYHQGGATLDNASPYKLYLNFRNNLLMMYKNLPLREGRRRLFIRRLSDTVALMRYLLTGKWACVMAVWNAHTDFRSMRGVYTNQPEENILTKIPECRHNIIWDYFIKHIRCFSELK